MGKLTTAKIVKSIVCAVCIIIGIIIVAQGFSVMNVKKTPTTYMGGDVKFGADFYTYMYGATQDVGKAVNGTTHAVNAASASICTGIGWLIVAIGLTEIGVFAFNLCNVLFPAGVQRKAATNENVNQPARSTHANNVAAQSVSYSPPVAPTQSANNAKVSKVWNALRLQQGKISGRCETCGTKREELVFYVFEDQFGKAERYLCYDCFEKKYKP